MRPLILNTASKSCHDAREAMNTEMDDEKPWYYDIQNYLKRGELLEVAGRKDRLAIQRLSSQFISVRGDVYKRQPNGIQLKYLRKEEADKVMAEIHGGVCGPHMSGLNLSRKIIRQGFYWITMEADCVKLVRHCHNCQTHGNLNHLLLTELHVLSEPWPFSAWGIDLVGEIKPQASNGHRFIVSLLTISLSG